MKINLEKLYKGNAVKIKNKEFLDTKSIVEDFVNYIKEYCSIIEINVKLPDNILLKKKDKDGFLPMDFNYIYYPKIMIIGIIDEPDDEYKNTIGISYSLEEKQPYYKVFTGYTDNDNNYYNIECNYYDLNDKIYIDNVEYLLNKRYNDNPILNNVYNNHIDYLGNIIYKSIYNKIDNGKYGVVMISTKDIISSFRKTHNPYKQNKINDLYISIYKDIKEDFFNVPEKSSLLLDILSIK